MAFGEVMLSDDGAWWEYPPNTTSPYSNETITISPCYQPKWWYSCPKCSKCVEIGDRYCKHCGEQLFKACPHCGKEI